MIDGTGTCKEAGFIFYLQPKDLANSVIHSGDNTDGVGTGDDEKIIIDLDKVPADITRIAFTVTIYKPNSRHQNFGMVSNSYIRVLDADTQNPLCRFDLGEDFSTQTAVVAGEIYKNNGEWKFKAVGEGYNGGLAELCRSFNLDVKSEE